MKEKLYRYRVTVPPASAKRLEKDRRLVIEASHAFGVNRREIPIQEGQAEVEFEVTKTEVEDHEILDDGNVYYSYYIEYRNSTGTRVEKYRFKPQEVDR